MKMLPVFCYACGRRIAITDMPEDGVIPEWTTTLLCGRWSCQLELLMAAHDYTNERDESHPGPAYRFFISIMRVYLEVWNTPRELVHPKLRVLFKIK